MQVPPSPLFAGRERELGQLAAAFLEVRSGATRIVLVSGEAGAGKTRLVREFAALHAAGATVLSGGCTDQAESGLPYAPVSAAIRRLVRERGAGPVTGLVGAASAGDLAWLLPEFGAPRSLPDLTIVRSRLFEVVRLLVERVADAGPVVWVFEDMHWADAGSRDMLRFLAANLADVPALLVVTSRLLPGDAPARALMAELGRTPFARTLVLPHLVRSEVACQLRGILGREPEAGLVQTVFLRGGGIPLFTEALVAGGETGEGALPLPVNDLLLGPVRKLPAAAQRLLQGAAVSGGVVRPALLAAVAGIDAAAVEAQLQPALAAHVLQAREDGYAFRHALIREAVEGAMPPHERKRLHHACALALEADSALGGDAWIAVALAHHWHRAGEPARALAAAWRGAAEAVAARSEATRLEMLELVIAQWPHLPDPAALLGASRLDVLEQAADAACWAAQPLRGLAHAQAALAMARERGDAARIAALLLQRAPMRRQLAVAGQEEDLEEALRLGSHLPALRIEALGQACRAMLERDRLDEAAQRAAELAEAAEAAGHQAGRLDAKIMAAMIAARQGADSASDLESLLAPCSQLGSGWLECVGMNALAECHMASGRPALAAETAARAARRCIEVGQWGYLGAAVVQTQARALQFAGRWEEALEALGQALDSDPAPFGRAQLLLCQAEIAAQRGDLGAAKQDLAHLQALAAALQPRRLAVQALMLDMHWAAGEMPAALALAAALDGAAMRANPQEGWPLLVRALRAHADAGPATAPPADLRALATALGRPGPVEQAYAALAAAECARNEERTDAGAWSALARTWAAVGQPWQQAYALMRAAALEGSRSIAAVRLQEAVTLAARLGAQPLLQRLAVVAQRRRVHAPGEGKGQAGAPFGLTERERVVLTLLAEGRTNRQIAAELVISAKTASVHVTNILGKLDVRTRGAAAAVAHRLGLAGRS